MKLLLLIVIAVVLVAGVAWFRQPVGSAPAGGGLPITGIAWRPVKIDGEPVPDDSGMFVTFELDGNITGHGGCNRFFGSLQQTGSGVEVGPLGSTRMACEEPVMDRETAFLTAIQKTRGFDSGRERVKLLDADGEVLVDLVPGG